MSDTARYVRYSDAIETPDRGERETIDGIIQAMTRESQTVAERDGKTVRAVRGRPVTGGGSIQDVVERLGKG